MKKLFFFFGMALILMATGCQKEEIAPPVKGDVIGNYVAEQTGYTSTLDFTETQFLWTVIVNGNDITLTGKWSTKIQKPCQNKGCEYGSVELSGNGIPDVTTRIIKDNKAIGVHFNANYTLNNPYEEGAVKFKAGDYVVFYRTN